MVTHDMLIEALVTFDERNFIGTPERLSQRLRDPAFSWDECPRSPVISSSDAFLKDAAQEVDRLTPALQGILEEVSEKPKVIQGSSLETPSSMGPRFRMLALGVIIGAGSAAAAGAFVPSGGSVVSTRAVGVKAAHGSRVEAPIARECLTAVCDWHV